MGGAMLYIILLIPLLAAGGILFCWTKRKIYRFQYPLLTALVVICVASLAFNVYYWRDIPSYIHGGEVIETDQAAVVERRFRRGGSRVFVELDGKKLWGEGMLDLFGGEYQVSYDTVKVPKGRTLRIHYLPHTGRLLKIELLYEPSVGFSEEGLLFVNSGMEEYITIYGAGFDVGNMVMICMGLLIVGCLVAPLLIWRGQGKE